MSDNEQNRRIGKLTTITRDHGERIAASEQWQTTSQQRTDRILDIQGQQVSQDDKREGMLKMILIALRWVFGIVAAIVTSLVFWVVRR